MKNINIENPWMKLWYVIAWLGFIVGGAVVVWVIALIIYNYKDVDKEHKKGLVDLTSLKLIFVYGSIVSGLIILGMIFGLLGII